MGDIYCGKEGSINILTNDTQEKYNEKALLAPRLYYSSGKIVTLSLSQVFYYDNKTFKSNKMLNDTLCTCTLCVYAIQTNNYFAKLSLSSNQTQVLNSIFSKIFDFKLFFNGKFAIKKIKKGTVLI